jgi:hypothetical protein
MQFPVEKRRKISPRTAIGYSVVLATGIVMNSASISMRSPGEILVRKRGQAAA